MASSKALLKLEGRSGDLTDGAGWSSLKFFLCDGFRSGCPKGSEFGTQNPLPKCGTKAKGFYSTSPSATIWPLQAGYHIASHN
jgi:hypothetical protein